MRPSHGTIVAYLALFVALGGTGYAAVKVNGKNIKNKTVAGTKLKDRTVTAGKIKKRTLTGTEIKTGSLVASNFKAGQVPAGPPGSPAGSVVQGNTSLTLTSMQGSEDVFPPSGSSPQGGSLGGTQIAPNAPLILRDFAASLGTAPGAGRNRAVRLVALSPSSPYRVVIGCTIADTATTCNSGSATGTLKPGEVIRISIFTSTPGPAASAGASWAYRTLTP